MAIIFLICNYFSKKKKKKKFLHLKFVIILVDFRGHPDAFVMDHIAWIIHSLMDPNFKRNRQGKSSRPVVRVARIRFADAEAQGKVEEEAVPVPQQLARKLTKLGAWVCRKTMECCQERQCRSCLNILSSLSCHDLVI